MRQPLKPHPDFASRAATGIEVDVEREGSSALSLTYVVTGTTAELAILHESKPTRADGLWQHTCFEAFVRPKGSEGYFEFNFSPSTQWAVYRFDGYRAGMRPAEVVVAPRIALETHDAMLLMQVIVEPGLLPPGPWQLGLSAVIEAKDGSKSYWALAHPPKRPDFHHADCFALELA